MQSYLNGDRFKKDRRKFVRFPFTSDVQFSFAPDVADKTYQGHALDISPSGICLLTDCSHLDKASEISIDTPLPFPAHSAVLRWHTRNEKYLSYYTCIAGFEFLPDKDIITSIENLKEKGVDVSWPGFSEKFIIPRTTTKWSGDGFQPWASCL